MTSFTDRSTAFQKVRKALRKEYGKQTVPVSDCIARQILWFVLLEQSSFQQAEQSLERIDKFFVDLNELRVSLAREIASCIPGTPDAEAKAHRATRVFNSLFWLKNTMDWSFVRGMGVRELRQFFENLEGGDPVLAAAMTMFFSTGHAIPADADVQRTLGRLGLSEEKDDAGQLQSFLERAVTKEEGCETWALLHRLAESVCFPGEPVCEKCPVLSLCPFGEQKMEAARQQQKKATAKPKRAKAKSGDGESGAKVKSAGKGKSRSAKAKPAKSLASGRAAKAAPAAKSGAKAKTAAKTTRASTSAGTGGSAGKAATKRGAAASSGSKSAKSASKSSKAAAAKSTKVTKSSKTVTSTKASKTTAKSASVSSKAAAVKSEKSSARSKSAAASSGKSAGAKAKSARGKGGRSK